MRVLVAFARISSSLAPRKQAADASLHRVTTCLLREGYFAFLALEMLDFGVFPSPLQ